MGAKMTPMSAVWIENGKPRARQNSMKIERENHKLEKRLCRLVGQAIGDYNMIEEGDKVMVCLSGGKDSYAMLDILLKLQRARPSLRARRRQPRPEAARLPEHVLPDYLKALGVPFHIEDQDTYSIVKDKIPEGKTMCSLCSRLRRGILYRVADELGATKIALGHHRDDMLQTLFLNMFFGGKLKGMPPKLVSDDGKHMVIRPLAYVTEKDLVRWAEVRAFPIIPCTCAAARRTCSASRSARCCGLGQALPRPARQHAARAAERGAVPPERCVCGRRQPRRLGRPVLPIGGGIAEPPYFKRDLSLVMRDLRTNQVAFETRALHDGVWGDTLAVLPAMLDSALRGFPQPPPGTRRINVEIPR
jgi:tRNA 2-thiocytidine biosynthesis protein TtcA